MNKLPLSISVIGKLDGRYGISVAAALHADLMRGICDQVIPCEAAQIQTPAVYHHAEAPQRPPHWYGGRNVIGYWVVESSVAAAEYKASADACAQIWTCSEASAKAIRALGSQTPVLVVPHPVTAPASVPDRSSRDTVTTLFAFCPGWSRKNPEATIRAWQKAFPQQPESKARLIIKCRLAGPAQVRLLELLCGDDERIEIITEDVSDEAMAALYDRADIFLSLHHAGAFELHVAEAAAHGLPVVSAAVGGVLDYLPSDGACLIAGDAIPPQMEGTLNASGEWINPDLDAAVAALKKLARSPKLRLAMGAKARASVQALLSPERVTELMRVALAEVMMKPTPAMQVRPSAPGVRRELVHVRCTPQLQPVRAGLEYMSGLVGAQPPMGTPLVMSHRRSGTHLLGEMLTTFFGFDGWLKSHDWPERRPTGNHPAVYVVRNPIDALWETYQWWRKGGGAHNPEIAAVMDTFSFVGWLNGDAGRSFGFQSWRNGDVDSLEITRGQMYDPMRYWRDHVFGALDSGVTVVRYEDLVTNPGILTQTLATAVKRGNIRALEVIPHGVGLAASADNSIGKAWDQWSAPHLSRLHYELLTPPLMQALGHASIYSWVGRQ